MIDRIQTILLHQKGFSRTSSWSNHKLRDHTSKDYSLGGPTVTIPQSTGQFSDSCSDLGTKCLSCPLLTVESWGIPGNLPFCSLHQNPEEVDFMPAIATILMNMLAKVAKAGQKESLLLGSPFTWAAPEDVFSLQII